MSVKKSPLVSIIIPNYNGRQLLERFLPSVVSLNYPNFEVIIVDNASNDASYDFIKKNYPQIKVIHADKNYGTAEGSNIGLTEAEGEFLFFISNDMELDKDMLDFMVLRMLDNDSVGICTCKMRRLTDEGVRLNIIDSVGSELDIFGFPCSIGINQEDKGQFDTFRDVFFSFGGALLIKKDLFVLLGGYDPAFFTLADDIDLSWRVRLLGYRVVAEPKSVLYHRVSATLGTIYGRSYKRYLSERNTLMALIKNYSLFILLLILPLYALSFILEIIFFAALRRFPMVLSYLRAISYICRNFRAILKKRRVIQSLRKVSDWDILRKMRFTSHKFEIFLDFVKNFGKGPNWDNYFGT
ncbi:MAG: glycosyltransferase family 2 protein [Candidatus Omnitrophota bacterium]|jgi:GT2 family glycosyltransferase|nr:MAG: glycosyltransferase family 2 protein [Candidatus Omnitrophota bacterium]